MYFDRRCAGVLLPLFSLPDVDSDGDLGHQAYRFVEFLHACGFHIWQLLPIGPVHADGSPYLSLSSHAGNDRIISLDWLRDRGWLTPTDRALPRESLLERAFDGFHGSATAQEQEQFRRFRQQSEWLTDYALFMVVRNLYQQLPWTQWPQPLRDREPVALGKLHDEHRREFEIQCFIQFVFFQQWAELRAYAHQHDVQLFGDMPLFVSLDSADVWSHRDLFMVDDNGQPQVVAGTPPDYFAEQGQRWGNPMYHWERMRVRGFAWWKQRIATHLELFDVLRIDHFRGLQACWEIPADADTAASGQWIETPGHDLLSELANSFPELPLIAEDLGTITPEVDQLRDAFHIPGMRVLQFGFDGDPDNPHAPHSLRQHIVVYTGTHDNNTSMGWYMDLPDTAREQLLQYLAYPAEPMPWPLIKSALSSVAQWAILPLQDLLALDASARVNTPGTVSGNWRWRFDWEQLPADLTLSIKNMLHLYSRD